MTASIFALLSVFVGLALLNTTVVIHARTSNSRWLGALPLEVRYVAMVSLIFLIALNANQWAAGKFLFPLMASVAMITIVRSARNLTACDRRHALSDGICLLFVQSLTLLAIFVAFEMHRYWLLEGPNHDSLIYYQGLHWATDSRLFVGKDTVRALWGLGVCREGASWIGYDCPLYRGGTYTVAAWAQYFAPSVTGNGLYLIAVYAATVVWFSVRLLPVSIIGRYHPLALSGLSLVVAFSTGLIGALTNGNLATVLGAASLVPIVCLALRSDISSWVRFGLMAMWCAVAAHVYAEAVFYAGLFISFVFLLELPSHLRTLRIGGIFALAGLLILIVFGAGNIAVGQAFASLFLFNELPKDGAWFSWYMHQSNLLWIGSFIAGILVDGGMPSIPVVIISVFVTMFSLGTLMYSRQTRSGVLALIGTSFLAVLYIELTGYQYGEHKIVHLLGPVWVLMLVAAASRLLARGVAAGSSQPSPLLAKSVGWSILLYLVLIATGFSENALSLLRNARDLHSIDFGLSTVASYIRPGDKVFVDDTAWVGAEKFQKTHYLTFQIHHQGAEVLLPRITSDPLRGGYYRGSRHDTFGRAGTVDWLIQSRGHWLPSSKLGTPAATLIRENAHYRLYRVGKGPLIAAGNGWYDCEILFCWTTSPFEIEAFAPQGGEYQLMINFGLYLPPGAGTITVRNDTGQVLAEFQLPREQMRIVLPSGRSRLVFDSDWQITSPLAAGVSADSRRLFAAIQRVEVIPLHEHAGN